MKLRKGLSIIALMTALIIGGAGIFVYSGFYNVSALEQHTGPVYRLLQFAMVRAAYVRSEEITVPDLEKIDWHKGARLYVDHCQQCHGSPGHPPEIFSLGMMPAPTAIAAISREREPRHIYWITKNGIKMSGMPAWKFRLSERELWQLTAFVDRISHFTVDEYVALIRRLNEREAATTDAAAAIPEPAEPVGQAQEAAQGKIAFQQYNCVSCHTIPGVTAARNHVGPPLSTMAERAYIAGILENNRANLIRWIRFPHAIDPDSTMPNLGVTEEHARQMVAYLESLVDETATEP